MSLFEELQHQMALIPAIQALPCEQTFKRVAETAELSVYRDEKGEWLFRLARGNSSAALKVSNDYGRIEKYLGDEPEEEIENFMFCLRTAFECRFCHEGIVSLHAACVEKDGFAVAFTGPSGIGKSTRARAWAEGLGAQFISGDRPLFVWRRTAARPAAFLGTARSRSSGTRKCRSGAFWRCAVLTSTT